MADDKKFGKKRISLPDDSPTVVAPSSLDGNMMSVSRSKLIAKKDFVIHHNDYHREIHIDDDISDVPEMYHANLKAEGVL